MRQFPSGANYVEALQNTTACFEHPELRGGAPELTRLGLPKPISGQFASVFAVTSVSGYQHAVKCFTREVPDQARRYRAISDHLASVDRPWKVGFEYLAKGIYANNDWYPLLKMDWIRATSLTKWIDDHLGDRAALAGLPERFANLVADLAELDIGHGDLQHGNILVTPGGSLRLVDYDGMYVPALNGLSATEIGHRNYQSPSRTSDDFGTELDRFAAWVIYLSLFAIAVDPGLWRQLREVGAEHLLLAQDDFTRPGESYRLSALLNHSEPSVRQIAGQLQDMFAGPLKTLPELKPVESAGPASHEPSLSTTGMAPAGGIPGWMSTHITDHPNLVTAVDFGRRSPALSTVARGGLFVFALGVITAAVGVSVGVALALVAVLIMLVSMVWSVISFRRTPAAQQAATVRAERHRLRRQVRDAESVISLAEARKEQLAKDGVAARMTNTNNVRSAADQHQKNLMSAQRDAQREVTRIDQQLSGLRRDLDQAMSVALQQLRDAHVTASLSAHRISPGKVAGIGKKVIDNLHAKGIRTAADFVDVKLTVGQRQSITADFLLRDGRLVHVDNIGGVKGRALQHWRETLRYQAMVTQPTVLSDSRRSSINAQFAARTVQLQSSRKQVDANLAQRTGSLSQRHAAGLKALRDDFVRKTAELALAQHEQDTALGHSRRELAAARSKLARNAASVSGYRKITYLRYVGFQIGFARHAAI